MNTQAHRRSSSNAIHQSLQDIREELERAVQSCDWPELKDQLHRYLLNPGLPAISILAPAACASAGGQPRTSAPVAAASMLVVVCTRWLDDLADRDRDGALWQEIGTARAITLAAGALTLAWQILVTDTRVSSPLMARFGKATLQIGAGQDLDLSIDEPSVEESWEIMRGKTAAGFAMLCAGGAWMAGADPTPYDAFGEHLGVLIQLLDDLDSVIRPLGLGDLRTGKGCNLVLVHGLRGRYGEEIRALHSQGEFEALRGLLIRSGSTRAVLAAAVHERELALESLAFAPICRGPLAQLGRESLIGFARGVFSDLPQGVEDLSEV